MHIRNAGIVAALGAAVIAACAPKTADDPSSLQIENVSQDALDAARLELEKRIASKSIAGGAHMVVRNGEVVYFHVAGVRDIEDRSPLEADTIMRIYSMTKPITSVAAMTLWQQGKFKLDDPVSKYIPAFENTRVLVQEGDSTKLVPAQHPITVRDVFRHSTGYTYGRETPELFEHYETEGMLYDAEHGLFPPSMSIAEAADSLARIPALHQPGATWTYGFSTDLLGRLVEIWSGKAFDEYLQEAVFTPLEMVDTSFSVPKNKQDRFASCHKWEDGEHFIADKAATSPFLDGFEFLSGGGGLVSTMQDYANFCQMLIDGGEFKGKRILEDSTVALMFTDQLSGVAGEFRFGLGFAIDDLELGSGEAKRSVTVYSWGGYANTFFEIVPEANMFQLFMRQSIPHNRDVANAVFPLVYSGVD